MKRYIENDWARAAMIAAIPVLLLLFLTMFKESVSRAQVSDMIQKESPYVEDREHIKATIDETKEDVKQVQQEIREIQEEQVEQRVKIDDIKDDTEEIKDLLKDRERPR